MPLLEALGLKPLPKLQGKWAPAAPGVRNPSPTGTELVGIDTPFAGPPGYASDLRSLSVRPGDMTVDGEQEVLFTAIGIDAMGDEIDLTFDVEWTTSNAAAASIDPNGKAQAQPVSGRARIMAAHALSGLTGSAVLTVTLKERAGPKLPPETRSPPNVTAIVIAPQKPRVVLHRSEQLTASSVFDSGGGQDETLAVEWESTDPSIVSVDVKGLVTGHRLGEAIVSATEPNTKLHHWVTVDVVTAEFSEPAELKLIVSPLNPSLHAAQLLQFHAVAEYSDGISQQVDARVTWMSSAPDVVKIDATGMAIGRNPGSARITATYWEGRTSVMQASTDASVPTLKSLAIEPVDPSLLVGEEHQFAAMGVYTDGSRKETSAVLWRSSDLGILTFDARGRATGRGVGSAMIIVMLESKSPIFAQTKVAVKAAAVSEMTIEMMNAGAFDGRMQRGQRLQLRAMAHSAVGSGKVTSRHLPDAVWSSADAKIAQVKDGIVRALKVGDTVIAATDKGSGITARTPLHVVEERSAGGGFPENFDKLPAALSTPYREAKVRYDELQAQLRTLDNVPHLMASLQDIVADIDRGSWWAVDKAENLRSDTNSFSHIEESIRSFEASIERASIKLVKADESLAVHAGRVAVAELRHQGKEQDKNIKLIMGLLKGAWKAYKADYVGAALEVVSGVLDRFVTSDYDKAADALEKTLDKKMRILLQDDLDAVKLELKLAHEASERIKALAANVDASIHDLREKAERIFDEDARKGSFRFADLTTALRMADHVVNDLVPAVKQSASAASAAIEKALPRAPRGSEPGLLLREMHEDALRWFAESVTVAQQVDTQRQRLHELRQEALTALAFAKPAPPDSRDKKK